MPIKVSIVEDDARVREGMNEIAMRARPHARIASETPGLVAYYGQLAGRSDLVSLSLSDKEAMRQFETGDFVIVARGRRYFSNEEMVARLEQSSAPVSHVSLGIVPAMQIFMLDDNSLKTISETLK